MNAKNLFFALLLVGASGIIISTLRVPKNSLELKETKFENLSRITSYSEEQINNMVKKATNTIFQIRNDPMSFGGFGTFPESENLKQTMLWKEIERNTHIQKVIDDSCELGEHDAFIYCMYNQLR